MPSELDPEGLEARALREAVDFSGARVLEIGCGDGRLAFRYASAPVSVVAIDTSVEDVRLARQACPRELQNRLSLIPADVRTLPFRDGSFDIAVLAWSL